MAMDTAMTNNWHQPVQSIGSSKGDGIVFKHKALLVFNIDPTTGCDIILPTSEDDKYPHMYPLRMAMLIAQHSASIPDEFSITYTPTSKWNNLIFGQPCKKGDEGMNALVSMGMGGGGGKKRMRLPDSPSGSSVTSCNSCCVDVLTVVPTWVVHGFINAVHRASMGTEVFSKNNFRQEPANLDGRGMPEIAELHGYAGDSFAVKKAPCIVSAAMDGVVMVHKGNKSYMWVAKKAKISTTGEKLVYMRCLDPECQNRVKNEAAKKNKGLFDQSGWALLDKHSMGIIDKSSAEE